MVVAASKLPINKPILKTVKEINMEPNKAERIKQNWLTILIMTKFINPNDQFKHGKCA